MLTVYFKCSCYVKSRLNDWRAMLDDEISQSSLDLDIYSLSINGLAT